MRASMQTFSPLLIGIAIVTVRTIDECHRLQPFSPLLIGIAIVTHQKSSPHKTPRAFQSPFNRDSNCNRPQAVLMDRSKIA